MKKTLVLIALVLLTACDISKAKAEDNRMSPTNNVIETVNIAENSNIDCSFQEKTVNGDYYYRAPCGGFFVVYSHALFRGDRGDSGVMGYFIALVTTDNSWHKKAENVDWVSLYGTDIEAASQICNEIKNPSYGIQRSVIGQFNYHCQ